MGYTKMRLFPLLYVLGNINARHEAGHVDKTVFIKATDQQMQEAKRSDLRDSLRKRKKKGRVVGGTDVNSPSEFPFYVSLFYSKEGYPFCGGTILDAYTILTAAHCANPKFIKAGSVDRAGQNGIFREVLKCQNHPQTSSLSQGCWTMDYQICRLKQPIPLDNYKTKPAQLGSRSEFDQFVKRRSGFSDMCEAIGYGRAGKGGTKTYKTKPHNVLSWIKQTTKSLAASAGSSTSSTTTNRQPPSSHKSRTCVNQLAMSGNKIADGTDTDKCVWTKVGLCTAKYPTVPCYKPPAKWPRKYNKLKQERSMAVHFLNEKPCFIEKNSRGEGCCDRKSYYNLLKRLYRAAKIDENAKPCMALATEHQGNKGMKVRKFDMKLFTSFCVLARQMHANKEEVQAGLLRGTHDRTCVMRALDTKNYQPRSISAIYCEFVRLTNLEHFKEKIMPLAQELCV